jgi:hypothetical protein
MHRLRDRLVANTSIPPIDISIFESLERCTHFSLGDIAQREDKVIAKRKTLFKEEISEEQGQERHDHLYHYNETRT